MTTKKRLKSTSKGGQSQAARANESKGKKKTRLKKDSKDEKAAYKKLPASVKKKIKSEYKKGKKTKTRVK